MIEVIYKLIALVFSLLMLSQAYFIKTKVGTFIIPSAIFSLSWFFYTFFPLVILFRVPINPISILFIFLSTTAFSLSAVPFNWVYAFDKNKQKTVYSSQFKSIFLHCCFYLSVILSLIFSTFGMISNGFDMNVMLLNLLEVSGQYAAMRGQEQLEYGIIGILSVLFTYMSPVLGGFIVFEEESKRKKTFHLFIAFVPSLYSTLTQSAKLIILVSIMLFFASTLLMKIYSGKLILFKRFNIYKILLYCIILLSLLSVSFLSRQGYSDFDDSSEAFTIIINLFSSYALGQIYAFSDFFSYYMGLISVVKYKDDFYSLGYYSFKSIFDSFGGNKQFPPGYFEEAFYYKDVFSTNIFTIFRSLIYDFGGLGTIIFMFLFGLIIHGFYYTLLISKKSWISCSVFVISVVFILISYLFSIFTARYILLIGLSLFIILSINSHIFYNKMRLNHD